MRLAIVFLVLAALAVAAVARRRWRASGRQRPVRRRKKYQLELELAVEGEKVTGTIYADQGSVPIEEAKVDGDQLSFKIPTDQGSYTLKFTVTGDQMKGKYTGPAASRGTSASAADAAGGTHQHIERGAGGGLPRVACGYAGSGGGQVTA